MQAWFPMGAVSYTHLTLPTTLVKAILKSNSDSLIVVLQADLLLSIDMDSVQWGLYVVGATNKFTWTTKVLWRKRDGAATLSRGEHLDPCLDRLLLAF